MSAGWRRVSTTPPAPTSSTTTPAPVGRDTRERIVLKTSPSVKLAPVKTMQPAMRGPMLIYTVPM